MDPLLVRFNRQYLQQIQNLTYPQPKLLIHPDIQDQLYKYFFDGPERPPPSYQRKVLKEVIKRIESSICDPDQDAVSDRLMEHISYLSTIPLQDPATAATEPQLIKYTLPEPISDFCDHNAKQIVILETPHLLAAQSNTGLRTWEASLHLATYLHAHKELVRQKNVIELGAGTGLVSLLCAGPLGANYVLSTDGAPHVVEGMKANFVRNREGLLSYEEEHSKLFAKVLDWSESDTEILRNILDMSGDVPAYNTIVGADITYHPDVVPVLAELLRVLMTDMFPENGIEAYISATVRNEVTLTVFRNACLERGLVVEKLDFSCPSVRDQNGLFHEQAFPIIIMRIRNG